MKEKKQIYRQWWFWGLIIIVIFLAIVFTYITLQENSNFNNYKRQSIDILNDYKKGELTKEEAKEKIEAVDDKIDIDYKKENTTNLLFLSIKLTNIEWNLVEGELSDTEVDNYIKEIKDIKTYNN